MSHPLERVPEELCSMFLGWRLGQDREALLARGEGALRIDLLSGECWDDDEPMPTLFIADELRRELGKALEAAGLAPQGLIEARLEAPFRVRPLRGDSATRSVLDLAVHIRLSARDGSEWSAEAHNRPEGPG